MRLAAFSFLFLVGVAFPMIYCIPVEKTFPEDLYDWVGTKSTNFQYMILTREPDLVILIKGWIFSPVALSQEQEYTFKLFVQGEDFQYETNLKGERSGIYIRLPQHLLVLPSNTKSLRVNDFIIEIPGRIAFSTKPLSHGGVEPGIRVLDETFAERYLFEGGQRIFLRIDAGQRNTGGYRVLVDEIKLVGKKILIQAHIESPEPGSTVIQVITYPSVLIEIQSRLEVGHYTVECVLRDGKIERRFITEFEVR